MIQISTAEDQRCPKCSEVGIVRMGSPVLDDHPQISLDHTSRSPIACDDTDLPLTARVYQHMTSMFAAGRTRPLTPAAAVETRVKADVVNEAYRVLFTYD